MEFARRGPATAAAGDDGRHSPDPPATHGFNKAGAGDAMLEIRDALLSQLQKDCLRQEIIVAELAKIERAMALRSATRHGIAAANVEGHKPQFFSFNEEFVPHDRWPEYCSDVDEVDYPKKKDVSHGSVQVKPRKPATEDRFGECSRPCCFNGKAGEESAAFDEQKLQESNENIQPKKMSPSVQWELIGITIPVKKPQSRQKWSCAICQLKTPNSERQLQEHCAGKKYRSNIATLESRNKAIDQKAETTTEPSSCADQKTSPIQWSCSTCEANGTSEADLKEHLNGRTHQQNIEAQCQEGDGMAKNVESQKAKCHKSNVPQHEEKAPCSICHANCSSLSELGNQLLEKFQAVLDAINNMATNFESLEVKSSPNIVPQDAEQTSQSNCSIGQSSSDYQSCCSEPQLENPRKSRRRRKKREALHGEGQTQDAELGGMKPADKLFSDDSDSKSASSKEKQTSYLCEVCNLELNSESMLADHCKGEEHLEKQNLLNFCEVCNLQCNSGKMLAHHCTRKKHPMSSYVELRRSPSMQIPVEEALVPAAANAGVKLAQSASFGERPAGKENAAFNQQKLLEFSKPTPDHPGQGNNAESRSSGARGHPMGSYVELCQSPSKPTPVEEAFMPAAANSNIRSTRSASFGEVAPGHRQAIGGEPVEGDHGMQPLEIRNQSNEQRKTMDSAIEGWINKLMQSPLRYKPAGQNNEAYNEHKRMELSESTPERASSGLKRKLTAVTSPVKKQKPLGKWSCILCHVSSTSQRHLDKHLVGRLHQSNVAALQSSRNDTAEPYTKATSVWNRIIATDTESLRQDGKENVAEQNRELPAVARWTCSMCQAKCTSESNFRDHLGGRRHRENREALRAGSDRKDADSSRKTAGRKRYYCEVCNVQCTSEKNLESHFGGRRHRETLEGCD